MGCTGRPSPVVVDEPSSATAASCSVGCTEPCNPTGEFLLAEASMQESVRTHAATVAPMQACTSMRGDSTAATCGVLSKGSSFCRRGWCSGVPRLTDTRQRRRRSVTYSNLAKHVRRPYSVMQFRQRHGEKCSQHRNWSARP